MPHEVPQRPLDCIFALRSVAVIGATGPIGLAGFLGGSIVMVVLCSC
jgi:hypothetical protein